MCTPHAISSLITAKVAVFATAVPSLLAVVKTKLKSCMHCFTLAKTTASDVWLCTTTCHSHGSRLRIASDVAYRSTELLCKV